MVMAREGAGVGVSGGAGSGGGKATRWEDMVVFLGKGVGEDQSGMTGFTETGSPFILSIGTSGYWVGKGQFDVGRKKTDLD
jgi:hypothetical protein